MNKETKNQKSFAEIIYELEKSLLSPVIRGSRETLDHLIAEKFIEFGSSGKIYNKQDVLDFLPSENLRNFTITDFKIQELSSDIILATYVVTEDKGSSLRSSIWKRIEYDWSLVFHQGTKLKEKK